MDKTKNISPILSIKNLKKSFGDNHVLNGFTLELFEGENLVLMGKSGSGKSVMIKCLVGLMQPDEGSLEIMGKDISKLSQKEFNELRTQLGFLFQGSALYDSMTVKQNLEFPLRRIRKQLSEKEILKLTDHLNTCSNCSAFLDENKNYFFGFLFVFIRM